MPTDYAGNPASFPDPIVLPEDDVDDMTAASVNAALEALADRDAYLAGRLPQFSVVTLTPDYVSTGDATYHQVATISLPSYAAHFVLGGTIKLRLNGGAGYAEVRIRSSTAYGTAGTLYDESVFRTTSAVEIDFTPIIFTDTITGTHLYLEATDNGGAGQVVVLENSNLFAMWVRI